jgi:hypothetical protein
MKQTLDGLSWMAGGEPLMWVVRRSIEWNYKMYNNAELGTMGADWIL